MRNHSYTNITAPRETTVILTVLFNGTRRASARSPPRATFGNKARRKAQLAGHGPVTPRKTSAHTVQVASGKRRRVGYAASPATPLAPSQLIPCLVYACKAVKPHW